MSQGGFSGNVCGDRAWRTEYLLGIHTCERSGEEAELGRGGNQDYSAGPRSPGQPRRGLWAMYGLEG